MARRKAHGENGHEHHHHHGSVDYNVGRYAPKQSLGKVIVSVNNAEKVNLLPIKQPINQIYLTVNIELLGI